MSIIPPSTREITVFPLDQELKTFPSRFYSPNMTHGRASLEEIRHVLTELGDTIKNISNKGQYPLYGIQFCLVFIVTYALCHLLIDYKAPLSQFDIILLGVFGAPLFILICCYTCLRLAVNLKGECENILVKHNRVFVTKGLRWNLPDHFPKWVELRNEYPIQTSTDEPIRVTSKSSTQQPTYVPPDLMDEKIFTAFNHRPEEDAHLEIRENGSPIQPSTKQPTYVPLDLMPDEDRIFTAFNHISEEDAQIETRVYVKEEGSRNSFYLFE